MKGLCKEFHVKSASFRRDLPQKLSYVSKRKSLLGPFLKTETLLEKVSTNMKRVSKKPIPFETVSELTGSGPIPKNVIY